MGVEAGVSRSVARAIRQVDRHHAAVLALVEGLQDREDQALVAQYLVESLTKSTAAARWRSVQPSYLRQVLGLRARVFQGLLDTPGWSYGRGAALVGLTRAGFQWVFLRENERAAADA